MNSVHEQSTKRLPLGDTVYWLSNGSLIELLGISESTRKRDSNLLEALGLIRAIRRRRGYRRDEIEAFWTFRQLQNQTDRDYAFDHIQEVMETLRHDYYPRQETAGKGCY